MSSIILKINGIEQRSRFRPRTINPLIVGSKSGETSHESNKVSSVTFCGIFNYFNSSQGRKTQEVLWLTGFSSCDMAGGSPPIFRSIKNKSRDGVGAKLLGIATALDNVQ